MEIGELGALGINVQFHVEVELKKVQGSVTILQLYMEEILVLEMIQEVRSVIQIVVQVSFMLGGKITTRCPKKISLVRRAPISLRNIFLWDTL